MVPVRPIKLLVLLFSFLYQSINESENDDDDDDAYYTPPSTPTPSFFEGDGNEHNHKNFIFG